MVSEIINSFYVSVMSICWRSTLSLPLTWLFQLYSLCIHVLAIQIMRSEAIGFCYPNELDNVPNPEFPGPSVSKNRFVGRDGGNKNSLHIFQTWELARIFNTLDRNRDGMVSAYDLQGLLESLGLHYFCEDNMKTMMDLPEQMKFDEFCRHFASLLEESQSAESLEEEKEELREAFSVYDKDGDGFITPAELQEVLLRLGLEEGQDLETCKMMITRFDKNSDGRIDFSEFRNMMTLSD